MSEEKGGEIKFFWKLRGKFLKRTSPLWNLHDWHEWIVIVKTNLIAYRTQLEKKITHFFCTAELSVSAERKLKKEIYQIVIRNLNKIQKWKRKLTWNIINEFKHLQSKISRNY